MNVTLLTAEQVRQSLDKVFKYVRVGGEFRFMECEIMGPRHSNMLKAGEKASCAGAIAWANCEKGAVMVDSYSTSLEIGTDEEGWKALEAELGVEIKSRWE